ncbi:MAG: HEAT repeat domain-containing protein [Ignavibacteriae bacterium]|nr:HEAT repeat domain-containing protein [Ignavibacteriota bacterium]
MLGDRGDPTASAAAIASINDADPMVRNAAINASVKLDPQKTVPALLDRLKKTDEPADVAAVREALARIPAAQVAAPAAAALAGVGPRGAVALLDLLGSMKAPVPSAPVLALTSDTRAPVRGAAIRPSARSSHRRKQVHSLRSLPKESPMWIVPSPQRAWRWWKSGTTTVRRVLFR